MVSVFHPVCEREKVKHNAHTGKHIKQTPVNHHLGKK